MSRIIKNTIFFISCSAAPANLFVIGSFLAGGSSIATGGELFVLRPLACVLSTISLARLKASDLYLYKDLFYLYIAWGAIIIAQLVPLPPEVVSFLPGREILNRINSVAELGAVWRPASLTPFDTTEALMSLSVPLATLAMCCRLNIEHQSRMLNLLIIIGVCGGAIFTIQLFNTDSKIEGFFETFDKIGWSNGFFANKNHNSLFLSILLPLLAAHSVMPTKMSKSFSGSVLRQTGYSILICAVVLLILISNSRSGLILVVISCTMSYAFWFRKRWKKIGKLVLLVPTLLTAMAAILANSATSISRFVSLDAAQDLRVKVVPTVLKISKEMFPLGSGVGGFKKIYIWKEPDDLLSDVIMQQAHNDWLDVIMTSGIFGIVLLCVAFFVAIPRVSIATKGQLPGVPRELARAALVVLTLIGVGSFTDYPLRTAPIQVVAAICLIWLWGYAGKLNEWAKVQTQSAS